MEQINKKLTIATIIIFFVLTLFLVGCSTQNQIIQQNETNQLIEPVSSLNENTSNCANAGEVVGMGFPSDNCCDGLTKLIGVVDIETCLATSNGAHTCSDCGNAVCETWENKCNCVKDCNITICIAQGKGKMPGDPACCPDLDELLIYGSVNGTPECGATVISARICSDCGNNICDSGENKCNCPTDCS